MGRELIRRDIVRRVLTDQGMPRPARNATDPAPASGLAWYTNSDGIWPAAPGDAFAGAGASHQVIVVVPSLELIVVRNGDALGNTKPGFWGANYRRSRQLPWREPALRWRAGRRRREESESQRHPDGGWRPIFMGAKRGQRAARLV
jgi:hypothetical protein